MADPRTEMVLRQIAEAIRSIRYGSVEILIQDSRVVQIHKAEKIRVNTNADLPAPRKPQEANLAALPMARQAGLTPGGHPSHPSCADQQTAGGTRSSAQGG